LVSGKYSFIQKVMTFIKFLFPVLHDYAESRDINPRGTCQCRFCLIYFSIDLYSEMKCANEVNNSIFVGFTCLVNEVSQFSWLTPSARSLQICDENLPSFAVSTLVSFLREHSPNAERFTFPLCFHV
jgi:hypothetical protein